MTTDEFAERLQALRPRLHRYCARMIGSAVNGEDVLQDALLKAMHAHAHGAEVRNLEGWLFGIAHNCSLDFLRERSRAVVVPFTDEADADPLPEADVIAISFRTFLRLPELQRCAVILKDVLGHSVEEISDIAQCSPAATKSALQRGRAALRLLARNPDDTHLPLMADADRQKISAFVQLFQSGDFDAIRAMLGDDVKLDLVNRLKLQGRAKVDVYFTRYAELTKWRFALGAIEGRSAMLVFDGTGPMDRPAHFVLVGWSDNRIAEIRDFLFAPYALEAIEWVRLS